MAGTKTSSILLHGFVSVRNCPTFLAELSNLLEFPLQLGIWFGLCRFKLLYRSIYFMRQSCVELLCLYVAPKFLFWWKGIESVDPIPIIRYVAQSFFGLTLLRALRISCTMLFDLSGVKAMISLAAASTIQKIADSKIAIILAIDVLLFYQLHQLR